MTITYVFALFAGITAVGARIVKTGLVAYFPPVWAVTSTTGSEVNVQWGEVKNVSPNIPTTVEMEVTFAVDAAAPTSTITSGTDMQITVGGTPVAAFSLKIKENVG